MLGLFMKTPPIPFESRLQTEILKAHKFLTEFRVREAHRPADHAFARYLWRALQTAEVIEIACREGHPGGTAPLRRYLLECVLDMYLLGTSDSLGLDVTKSMVWDAVDWDKIWEVHKEAVDTDASLDTGNAQTQSVDEALEVLRSELEGLGQDPSLFEAAAGAARKSSHWHWSGAGPSQRLKELEKT